MLHAHILGFTALLNRGIVPKTRRTIQNQTMSIHAIVIGISSRLMDIEMDPGWGADSYSSNG